MTALSKSRTEQRIADEIHAVMHLYPSKANDADFICATVAEALDRAEKDVRKVWSQRFHIGGVC
ncbi:hypothetical protein SAMN04244548_01222 [Paracoccus pantotrophus]|nr:hypothetical protein SAMN04244548_01222 [Paracoccus pantotrophus]